MKLGLIRLHDGIVDVGASKEAVSRLFRALDDPDYTITGADTVIAWGARAR